ncbi:MAG: hypothetical protein WD490_07155, partial [Opitutales bacterium]
ALCGLEYSRAERVADFFEPSGARVISLRLMPHGVPHLRQELFQSNRELRYHPIRRSDEYVYLLENPHLFYLCKIR